MSPWAILGIVVAGAVSVGGAVTYHEVAKSRAFDRGKAEGIAETTERMTKAIQQMRQAATENQAEWAKKTPGEKTAELQRRCVAGCQGEPKCEAACKQ